MYHYITLGSMKIYMTGMGILAFIAVFLFIIHIKSKKYRLPTKTFWKYTPFYLLFTYLLSTYLYYLIEQHIIIPLHINQLLLYLSPYGYHFYFIGIVLGLLGSGIHFLKTIETPEKKQKWLHIFLSGIMTASIPLGIFLLLGDNFIGTITTSSFYVSAIKSDSHMAIYGKVIPLGLFLSLGFLIGLILYLYQRKKNKNIIYGRFALINIFLSILLLYQQYPKHFVVSTSFVTFDIKQYFLIILACIFLWKQIKHKKEGEIYNNESLETTFQENDEINLEESEINIEKNEVNFEENTLLTDGKRDE